MKQFINNIIAMVIALSISAVTVQAQDGMCNDFRTGISSSYTRLMTKEELIAEYKINILAMHELIENLKWHNTKRGWGFDDINEAAAITALEGGKIKKASGTILVARNCNGVVQYFSRSPKTRFGGEDVLYITVRGEDINIASLDCGNPIWDKHDIPEETHVDGETKTTTSKSGDATATATASVGDINITNTPPAVETGDVINNYYSNDGGGNYNNAGYGGGYYNSYGNYCNYGGVSAGIGFGFGFSAYAGFGWGNNGYYGNCGNYSSCGTPNFTPSSYNEYNTYNYYGDDDDGDIFIDIDIDNDNINNNNNINHTWIGGQEGKPIDPVDPGGPVDPPSGDGGGPIDPIDPGTTDNGNGTDPNGGNDPVDPGSGKTDETTVQTTETFKGSFETKSLSVNTNKKVADQQQLNSKKGFETGPSTFAMNSKVNANKNNEVFAKQTQLENYTKIFQTETASKTANQTLHGSDTQSKTFTISNSGSNSSKQQNAISTKAALQKEQPRTLKEFSAVALQNKQVSNDQQNMSLASKTAPVRNDANMKNGQQTFQDKLSVRGADVNVPQNQSFDRNEMSQKNFNDAGQNRNVDDGRKFQQKNPNSGSFNKRQDQNLGPQMNVNQQQQRQNVAPMPRNQNGTGNMRTQQQQASPMMMKNQNMGLAKNGR